MHNEQLADEKAPEGAFSFGFIRCGGGDPD
jgi:hypothetical protein